jgi:hypothetical protein
MTDIKTTVTGFVTAVLTLLSYFGILIPPGLELPIIAVGTFLVAFFAKDSTPTPPPAV